LQVLCCRISKSRPLTNTFIYVSSYYYTCVLMLVYMCPHTTICVLIPLYMCPHTTHTTLSFYLLSAVAGFQRAASDSSTYSLYNGIVLIIILILLNMCPHTFRLFSYVADVAGFQRADCDCSSYNLLTCLTSCWHALLRVCVAGFQRADSDSSRYNGIFRHAIRLVKYVSS
jgi:hypothetical protein